MCSFLYLCKSHDFIFFGENYLLMVSEEKQGLKYTKAEASQMYKILSGEFGSQ